MPHAATPIACRHRALGARAVLAAALAMPCGARTLCWIDEPARTSADRLPAHDPRLALANLQGRPPRHGWQFVLTRTGRTPWVPVTQAE